MRLQKSFSASAIRGSDRDLMRRLLDSQKFLRDRNDVYLLDLDSFVEDFNELKITFEYYCLEVKINPDRDW
jgi:hypothetical protein